MPTAQEIAAVFTRLAPLEHGIAGDEQGFIHGDPATPVTGVACLWNLHTRSLAACRERGLNLIFTHETIYLPPQRSPWYDAPATIASNDARRALLLASGAVVFRCHSAWDALPGDGVPDQAVAALGLGPLRVVGQQKYFKVHELPAPLPAAALRERVATGLDFAPCRLFGDGARPVRRFAFLIGGFGENQWHIAQAAIALGAEAIILGEMSEFIVIACLEAGVPVIESLHSASESPAIRRQAALLAAALPGMRVEFVPSGAAAWEVT